MTYITSLRKFLTVVGEQTWLLDTEKQNWEPVENSSTPPLYCCTSVVYAEKVDKVLLYGGDSASTRIDGFNYTYTFNPKTGKWTNATTDGPRPQVWSSAAMTYMVSTDRAVLFGLGSGPKSRDDCARGDETWEYDFQSNAWRELHPARSPAARSSSLLAYASHIDRVMLFGGARWVWEWDPVRKENICAHGGALSGTWAFDYRNNTWYEVAVSASPPPTYGHSLSYDQAHNALVLFGGTHGQDYPNDTWVYSMGDEALRPKDPDPGGIGDAINPMKNPAVALAIPALVVVLFLVLIIAWRRRRRKRAELEIGAYKTSDGGPHHLESTRK